MRRLRPLLLLAIAVILAGVGTVYLIQKGVRELNAPPAPRVLSPETSSTATAWSYAKQNEKRINVWEIRGRSFRQLTSASRILLEDVELRILN